MLNTPAMVKKRNTARCSRTRRNACRRARRVAIMARAAARALAAAGVPTEVRVWPGQIHDFQLGAPLIPEATRSLRQIGEYIREATG